MYNYPINTVPLFIRASDDSHIYVGHFSPEGAKHFFEQLQKNQYYIDGYNQEDPAYLDLQFFAHDDQAGYEISVNVL